MKILFALLIFYSGIVSAQSQASGTPPMLFKEYLFDPRWPVKFLHLWPGQTPPPERAVN